MTKKPIILELEYLQRWLIKFKVSKAEERFLMSLIPYVSFKKKSYGYIVDAEGERANTFEIARMLKVRESDVYKMMRSLTEKGFIELVAGEYPTRHYTISPYILHQ